MSIVENLYRLLKPTFSPNLPADIIHYAAHSYPSNHTFYIRADSLVPTKKLRKRFNIITNHYPNPLTSLLDVGCSKGFFVFAASKEPTCERSLGIDVTEKEIRFCNHIKQYLNASKTQFIFLQLHELANRIDEFGGAFQTVLVINLYQYLYFGSDHFAGGYSNHDLIFNYLNRVCAQRIIFNNRINLADCQNQSWTNKAGSKRLFYNENEIFHAASRYFKIKKIGHYGRYPLWVLEKK